MSSPAARSDAGARVVLASGFLLGVGMLAVLLADRSHMLAANFEVYQVAAEAALAGEDFYAVAPDRFPDFYYLYPPITIVPFLPFAAVDLWAGFLVHTALEVALGFAFAWLLVRWIERYRSLATIDYALIGGFVVGSIHTVPSLVYGQVNLRMAFLLAIGLVLLERAVDGSDGRRRLELLAGVALAGAALLKVFPAAIGLWLLRLRAWWTIAAAVATGLGGLALGTVVFGLERTRAFFFEALLPRSDDDAFVGGLDPAESYVTIRRPLSVLFDPEPAVLSVLAAVVLLVPLAYVYTGIDSPRDRLVGAHATLLVVFVYFPSFPLYYVITFGTLIPLLYLLEDRPVRWLFVGGALVANLAITAGTLEDVAATVPSVGDPLLAVAIPFLALSTPVLVGSLAMLAGCVLYRYRRSLEETKQ